MYKKSITTSYGQLENKRLLTVAEAADYSGIGKNQFRAWAEEIGCVRRIGRKTVRYDKTVLDAFINKM